jgi:hypothetical protein
MRVSKSKAKLAACERWLSDNSFAKIAGFKNLVLVSRKPYVISQKHR